MRAGRPALTGALLIAPARNGSDLPDISIHDRQVLDAPITRAAIDAIRFWLASSTAGGAVEVRADDPEGPLVGTAVAEPTGGRSSSAPGASEKR